MSVTLAPSTGVRQKLLPFADFWQKEELGQYMTPSEIVDYMASLFPGVPSIGPICRLLDAGAADGSLSTAFLRRFADSQSPFDRIELAAYEIDTVYHSDLRRNLAGFVSRFDVHAKIYSGDFIEHAVRILQRRTNLKTGFTHAILNPPYKKINGNSQHRLWLRTVGIETVNRYSAFVALAVSMMLPGGQVVAIIPRSFCNGPYYRPFREHLFENTAIRHIHLFESRTKAFQRDNVLQENVILRLERDAEQEDVTISTSTDQAFDDLTSRTCPFEKIVFPQDQGRFIHIPTFEVAKKRWANRIESAIRYSLDDLGIQVSTGPVVDFRLKEHLCPMPEKDTVPLLYPVHFDKQRTDWPQPNQKKPNAIRRNASTEK